MMGNPAVEELIQGSARATQTDTDDLFGEMESRVDWRPIIDAVPGPANQADRAPRLTTTTFAALLAAEIADEPNWRVSKLFPAIGCAFIAGPPKSFKTWTALHLAIAILAGKDFLGRRTEGSSGTVVYLGGEGRPEALKRNLGWLCRGMDVDPVDIADRLHLLICPRLDLAAPEGRATLAETIRQLQPKPVALILDPFSRLHSGNENDRTEVEEILTDLRQLSEENQLLIVVVHHARKLSEKNGYDALRGSSAMRGWSDALLAIDPRRADPSTRLIRAELRDAESFGPLGIRLVVSEGDQMARIEVIDDATAGAALGAAKQRVRNCIAEHGPVNANKIKHQLKSLSGKTVAACLKALVADGEIVPEKQGNLIVYSVTDSRVHEAASEGGDED